MESNKKAQNIEQRKLKNLPKCLNIRLDLFKKARANQNCSALEKFSRISARACAYVCWRENDKQTNAANICRVEIWCARTLTIKID